MPTASVVVSKATSVSRGLHLRSDALGGRVHREAPALAAFAPRRLTSSRSSQVGERGLDDEAALGNDDDVVDGLGDLGQKMAGHEHAASLVGVGAQEVAQPVHAFGVEAIGRFVKDEHLGLTQERGSETEALAHAERESLHPAVADVGEPDLVEHLVNAGAGEAGGGAQHAEVVRARRPGWKLVDSSTAPTWRNGSTSSR